MCLSSETDKKFDRIFQNQNQNFALKIFLISQVKIVELEENLALICHQCVKELYQCFVFRRKIQTSDEYFRSKLEVSEESSWKLENDTEPHKQESIEEVILKVESLLDSAFNGSECEYEALEELEEEILEVPEIEKYEPEISSVPSPVVRRGRKLTTIKRKYNRLTCKVCGVTLSRRQRLIQHERLHYLESTKSFYECDKCGKQFNQRFSIIPHFQKFHNYKLGFKERWSCAICVDKSVPAGKMEMHYKKCHAEFYGGSNAEQSQTLIPKKSPCNVKMLKIVFK